MEGERERDWAYRILSIVAHTAYLAVDALPARETGTFSQHGGVVHT